MYWRYTGVVEIMLVLEFTNSKQLISVGFHKLSLLACKKKKKKKKKKHIEENLNGVKNGPYHTRSFILIRGRVNK